MSVILTTCPDCGASPAETRCECDFIGIRAQRRVDELLAYHQARCRAAEESWLCFHCGERFTTRDEASAHFGTADTELGDVAACIDPLRHDEKQRRKELQEARDYAMQCQQEANEAENDRVLLASYRDEIGRLFGEVGGVKASTPHQAWLVLDYERGLVIAEAERAKRAETGLTERDRRIADLETQVAELEATIERVAGAFSPGPWARKDGGR